VTEHLTALLQHEADLVVVPTPDPDGVLRRGRRLRRRRRGWEALGVISTCVVLVGAGLLAFGPSHRSAAERRFDAASATDAYDRYGAFAVGSTVHIGNHEITFREKVKALYYTSEGVLVRMGQRAITDEPGPSHYTLVRPDGTTKTISLSMGDRMPGTDPDSPDVTYAEKSGRGYALVAVSLVTGQEVARSTVIDRPFTWGGWEAPPVTTVDHRIWALFDDGWVEFNWDTGTTRLVPDTRGRSIDAAHGVFADFRDSTENSSDWKIRDFTTGRVLADLPRAGGTADNPWGAETGWISPDGRYVRFDSAGAEYGDNDKLIRAPGPSRFVSVATGRSVSLPGKAFYGWTPDGQVLSVDAKNDRIVICDPDTGTCDHIDMAVGAGTVKLGGKPYES